MIVKIGVPIPKCVDRKRTVAYESIRDLLGVNLWGGQAVWCAGYDIGRSRDNLVRYGNMDFDYFLSVDSDIQFTGENVNQLIECDKPVMAGLYQWKRNRLLTHAGYWLQDGVIKMRLNYDTKSILPVDWTGGGFLLIRRDVFDKLTSWFYPFLVGKIQTSADFGFCKNCKDIGIQVLVNADCKVKHIGG